MRIDEILDKLKLRLRNHGNVEVVIDKAGFESDIENIYYDESSDKIIIDTR